MATMTFADFSTIQLARAFVDGGYIESLADRNALPMLPSIQAGFLGDVAGASTTTSSQRVSDIGTNRLTADAEGVGPASTEITYTLVSSTTAWRSMAYEVTTAARSVMPDQLLSPGTMVGRGMATVAALTLTDAIALLGSGFTSSVATTGAPNSTATMMAGVALASDGIYRGPFNALLYPKQWTDFTTNFAAVLGGGTLQFSGDPMLASVNTGIYAGNFMGVDFWKTTAIPTANAGADSLGFWFGPQGIVWNRATPKIDDPDAQILIGDGTPIPLLINRDLNGRAGISTITARNAFGVARGLDNGFQYVTDR